MSFLIAQWELAENGLMRVIREQAEKLAGECATAHESPAAFAHKARVRCKKIRAALRLAAPLMGKKTYARENRWWRDAARELSEFRDRGTRIEALESLRPFLTARTGPAMMRRLTERFEREWRTADAQLAISTFCARIAARGSELAPHLPVASRNDMAEALGETYREARRAMSAALRKRNPLLLHEWRKQTKYHALQTRLMRMLFPEALQDRTGATRELAELLGTVQDIQVVLDGVNEWGDAPEGLVEALKARRKLLIGEAERKGKKLFAQRPKAWTAATLKGEHKQPLDREHAEADL